ncbi:hypothetical protein NC651_010601 [Populus alba x Populus x berolinensis]|nr:hypothetical protein NC651_010601 [Populus alba x Populus x berolinensis]
MLYVSYLSSQTARIYKERFKNSSLEAILLQNFEIPKPQEKRTLNQDLL